MYTYLILLIDSDQCVAVKTVTQKTWDWINADPPPENWGSGWEETDPLDEKPVHVTIGSLFNDRALACSGKAHATTEEALKWARDAGLIVKDIYCGSQY